MSEAMTNTEIEDVLSSIRRLVAQETRPAPERLVLTAELRVGQANLTVAPTQAAPAPAGTLLRAVAVPGAANDAAPEGPADTLLPRDPDLASQPSPTASAVAQLIAAQPASTPSDVAPSDVAPLAGALPDAADGESATPDSVTEMPAQDASSGLEAEISALEAALGHAVAAPNPELSDTAEPPATGEMPPDPEPDVTLIDEADLENLVARLVREELRGQLGERITQQVRRLVRSEIARALDERKLLG